MSSITGIQGQTLEVTVVGCSKLKDTEWISRQDPYVCVEYANTKFRTRTCTDGGKNPTFQEKFVFQLIEGLREINVAVWNSNTITFDDFIGSGKVQLHKVLSEGFDDSAWPLQTKTGRHAGEVKVILHYANAKKPTSSYAPSAPYMNPSVQYSSHPPASYTQSAPSLYAPPPPAVSYPPPSTAYPASSTYPSYPSGYPPAPYPPSHSTYPPSHSTYHPHTYPPPPTTYPPHSYPPGPPPQHGSAYYPPGPYPGTYPPPPY